MNILHINSYYSVGGFYKNLFDKQVLTGLNIDVYTPVSNDIDPKDHDFGEYCNVVNAYNDIDKYLFYPKQNKFYKKILETYDIKKYDILHAHSLFSNGYSALRIKKKFGVPYIVAVRDTDINVFFKYGLPIRSLGLKILQYADKIIFLSKSYRNLLIKKYVPKNLQKIMLNKSEVVPNGIDEFWFKNVGQLKQLENKTSLDILSVGLIAKRKNVLTTVKVVEILRKHGYTANLTVVGKIVDQHIYSEIQNHSYVNYIPPLPQEELIQIYRDNDIFVMPSITETFGLVYAEAMSQGLPVIYTKGQGFDKQFREGKVGYGVDCFDPKEIANKIQDILIDYDNMSKNSLSLVNKFRWEDISRRYTSIYKEVTNKK